MLHSSAGKSTRWVWPEGLQRRAIPDMVPDAVGQDYKEAALVLDRSPRASAALSRRALQGLLTEQGFKHSNLSTQIDLALPGLAEPLKSDIDAIRQLGNMAAHPMKATQSGEILDVEPGEAEWSLDVLDALFDHYYVEKERSSARRAALNAKLKSAGKPPLK